MFYAQFIKACDEAGTYPTVVCRAIGINQSNATAYKRGSVPNSATLQKIADYLGKPVSYFYNDENTPQTELDEARALLEEMRARPELSVLWRTSKNLSASDAAILVRIAEGLKNASR